MIQVVPTPVELLSLRRRSPALATAMEAVIPMALLQHHQNVAAKILPS
jgi:hypothetical protein